MSAEFWQDEETSVLCDVLEIEVAIVAKDPACKCDEELSEGWVHIYEIGGFDVFGGEFAEVDFIEAKGRNKGGWFNTEVV